MNLVMGIKVCEVRDFLVMTLVMSINIGQVRVFPVLILVMGTKIGQVRDFPLVTFVMGIKVGEVVTAVRLWQSGNSNGSLGTAMTYNSMDTTMTHDTIQTLFRKTVPSHDTDLLHSVISARCGP